MPCPRVHLPCVKWHPAQSTVPERMLTVPENAMKNYTRHGHECRARKYTRLAARDAIRATLLPNCTRHDQCRALEYTSQTHLAAQLHPTRSMPCPDTTALTLLPTRSMPYRAGRYANRPKLAPDTDTDNAVPVRWLTLPHYARRIQCCARSTLALC